MLLLFNFDLKIEIKKNNIFVYNFPIQAISDFQEYLEEWHDKALENDWKFLSPGTYQGFQLTLKSTIEITMYLTENCGYKYLMTSRLNQDALEVSDSENC